MGNKAKVLLASIVAMLTVAISAMPTHAAALTQGDYNNAITNTIQPVQDFITGFLANGWLVIVGVFLILFAVVLAWRLGRKGLHRLFRLGAV